MIEAVLYHNDEQTAFVIDVPASIALSQGGGTILSTEPVAVPFSTPEPKGVKRQAYVARLPSAHVEYQQGIEEEIGNALKGLHPKKWVLPRTLQPPLIAVQHLCVSQGGSSSKLPPVILSPFQNDFASASDIQNCLVHNECAGTTHLAFGGTVDIHVPARCTFAWTSIKRGRIIMQERNREQRTAKTFELVLMDPPWPNRSVRRASKYIMADEQVEDPFEEALAICDAACTLNGYVATWITNKAAVRDSVLASMRARGFVLVEEWIWAKVTSQGELISAIDSVWRKPYEILLLFKQHMQAGLPTRRYLFAAPDVHSRKPNLKYLFHQLLGVRDVLELFARNLTAGWWCIGNEVLQFQQCRLWHKCPR